MAIGHGLELDLATAPVHRGRQINGVRGIGNIRLEPGQFQHGLHIDEGLPDLAIGKAKNVQGLIERDQDQDRRRDIAGAHPPGHGLMARQNRHDTEAKVHH